MCTLMCACTSGNYPHSDNAGDYVSINDGRLGWSGIFINETRRDVENKLSKRLDIYEQAFPSCGQYASRIALNNRVITLEWSGTTVDATVDSIYVDTASDENTLPAASIAEQIKYRYPYLTWMEYSNKSSELYYSKGKVILVKNGDDNFLLIASADCLD